MECKDSSRFIHLLFIQLRSEDHRQLSVESRFRRKTSGSLKLASTGDSGGQFVGPYYYYTKVCKVFMMLYFTAFYFTKENLTSPALHCGFKMFRVFVMNVVLAKIDNIFSSFNTVTFAHSF